MLASLLLVVAAVFHMGAADLQAPEVHTGTVVDPTGQEPVACELVDQSSAETILGSDAINVGGTAVPSVCRYQNAEGNLVFIVQILIAEMYDVSPINPQTAVDIGDRGRFGVGDSGTANVQFAKGNVSVTLRVTPTSGPPASALMDPLLEVARIAADRLPG